MSERTARRHVHTEAFQRAAEEATEQQAAQTAAALTALSAEAIQTLRDVMANGTTDGHRARAAIAVLTIGLRYREGEDLHRRLLRLEVIARHEPSAVGIGPSE
jgi:hypothetical protein